MSTLFMLTTLIASGLTTQPAYGLDCQIGIYQANIDEGQEVPTNVQLILWEAEQSGAFVLRDLDTEAEVPFIADVLGGDTFRLVPNDELQPNTRYGVFTQEAPGQAALTFVTGTGPDTTPPETPVVLSVTKDFGSDTWGRWQWIDTTLEGASEDLEGAYEVEVSASSEMTDSETVWVHQDSSIVSVGSGICLSNLEMDPKSVRFVRVKAVDLAGNTSEASVPTGRSGGCQQGPRGAVGVLVSLLSMILLRRRVGSEA